MLKKFVSKFKKFLENERTYEILDFIKLIYIHGLLGLFVLLIFISIIGLDFTIVNHIRTYSIVTIGVFLIGSGAFYYLFLDINNFLKDTWGKKR